jgi:hypothetical protein
MTPGIPDVFATWLLEFQIFLPHDSWNFRLLAKRLLEFQTFCHMTPGIPDFLPNDSWNSRLFCPTRLFQTIATPIEGAGIPDFFTPIYQEFQICL